MLIGIDFDNTIVCYDDLFHRVAVEQGLIPGEVAVTKTGVRDYLRAAGRENLWTALQGYIYGSRMDEAPAYPGVLEFVSRCQQEKIDVCIISHKTKHPFAGPIYDLHESASRWLKANGFVDPERAGLSEGRVYFELTMQDKLDRIASIGCTHFIDDLPEFLCEPGFPRGVERILFDPCGLYPEDNRLQRVASWFEITRFIVD
jgi:hypothetical protein